MRVLAYHLTRITNGASRITKLWCDDRLRSDAADYQAAKAAEVRKKLAAHDGWEQTKFGHGDGKIGAVDFFVRVGLPGQEDTND